MQSVAKSTAVSKPNVAVVLSRSLSIVLGTPMTRRPALVEVVADRERPVAAHRDESVDPRLVEPFEQLVGPVDLDFHDPSGCCVGYAVGFPRFVEPRMVPPRCEMPRTAFA